MTASYQLAIPSVRASYARIIKLEEEYRIRIGMWVSIHEDVDGSGYFQVHISASGDIYDHIPPPLGHAKARIIPAFDDPFGSACFACLDQLETVLARYAGYLVVPPTQ